MGQGKSKDSSYSEPLSECDTDDVLEPPPKGTTISVEDFWKYWTVTRNLGKGRTCEVVEIVAKNRNARNRGPYACKILRKGKLAMKKLFERECNILKHISHPNCIEFLNGYIGQDNYFIVTNRCNGGELFHRITTNVTPYSESEGRRICRDMLLAVGHIHENGIIHRDLKPENFMFDTGDRDSKLRLIDFGSAVIVEDGKSYKELAGTPYYMSPESVRNLDRSEYELRATDVWSIGIITYVIMSRRPPFGGPTNKDIFTKILKYKLKWPRACKWSDELKDFLRRIIEKDTFKRMTLNEALAHPWIKGEKLKIQMIHSEAPISEMLNGGKRVADRRNQVQLEDGKYVDTSIMTVADRQLSRDEPLI